MKDAALVNSARLAFPYNTSRTYLFTGRVAKIKSILLVCSDDRLRASLAEGLGASFAVQQSEDAVAAKTFLLAAGAACDAVLIDTGLRAADGPELCRSLRSKGFEMPILLLSEARGELDVVAGLDSGANDYILKPFSMEELLARLRAHMRISATTESAVRTIGPYAFRPSAKQLFERARNRTIRLTSKEVAVLKYLHAADGRPVAKHTLLMDVWGYNNAVSSHTLETHIWRLRQKMEDNPANARLLLTNRDGYRLNQAA